MSALEATLRAERSPHALSGLLSALYLLGQDSRLERLLQLLGHSDPQVRDQVISGLEFGVRQNERQQVINAIKDLLEGESHPSVRHNGEKLLAKLQLDQSKLNNDVEPTA